MELLWMLTYPTTCYPSTTTQVESQLFHVPLFLGTWCWWILAYTMPWLGTITSWRRPLSINIQLDVRLLRYCDKVVPDEFGNRHVPWFFLTPSFWGFKTITTANLANWLKEIARFNPTPENNPDTDDDVKKERVKVFNESLSSLSFILYHLVHIEYSSLLYRLEPSRSHHQFTKGLPSILVEKNKNR